MKPTVGRIVHYYEDGQGPFAATVTAVHDNTYCTLAILKPRQTSVYAANCAMQNVALSGADYWEWPPRDA